MALVFDTEQIPPTDRAEVIREAIWESVIAVDIRHHPDPELITGSGRITDIGRLNICSVRFNALTVRRTPRLTRDNLEPNVFLGLQVSGSTVVVQGGREALLHPGDLAFFDTTMPYTLLNNDENTGLHYFRIPRSELALPTSTIERVTALRMTAANPVVDVATAYLQRMAANTKLTDLSYADLMVRPSIELIRAVIATQLGDDHLAGAPLAETRALRILEYVRAHLGDHDLTAARIAHAHSISVRQLYTILARADISLGDWIRTQRLEGCRQDLAQPGAQSASIATVARRWGFTNPTHFSRVFREAYEMTPREWRESRRHGSCD